MGGCKERHLSQRSFPHVHGFVLFNPISSHFRSYNKLLFTQLLLFTPRSHTGPSAQVFIKRGWLWFTHWVSRRWLFWRTGFLKCINVLEEQGMERCFQPEKQDVFTTILFPDGTSEKCWSVFFSYSKRQKLDSKLRVWSLSDLGSRRTRGSVLCSPAAVSIFLLLASFRLILLALVMFIVYCLERCHPAVWSQIDVSSKELFDK